MCLCHRFPQWNWSALDPRSAAVIHDGYQSACRANIQNAHMHWRCCGFTPFWVVQKPLLGVALGLARPSASAAVSSTSRGGMDRWAPSRRRPNAMQTSHANRARRASCRGLMGACSGGNIGDQASLLHGGAKLVLGRLFLDVCSRKRTVTGAHAWHGKLALNSGKSWDLLAEGRILDAKGLLWFVRGRSRIFAFWR